MLLYSVVLFWFLAHSDSALGKENIITSLGRNVEEVFIEIVQPGKLLNDVMKTVFGIPEKAASKEVDKLCPLPDDPPIKIDRKSMSIILRRPCQRKSFSLHDAEKILTSPDFNLKKKVVIFITGWMSTPDDYYVTDMATAFNCRNDSNFLVLDTSNFIRIFYTSSAYNTKEIGRQLAIGLKKLIKKVATGNIHLIGHSLGAHIAGYAGHYFKAYTGLKIGRITGLDPAKPCFQKGEKLAGLQRGDASFIDVIHSNPGILGKKDPLGDVDFYPEGLAEIKPGCIAVPCSHSRSIDYFTESIYRAHELNFLADRCPSLSNLEHGNCSGNIIPMGLAAPINSRGNYFLHVNSNIPYGKNHKYRKVGVSKCGMC